MGFSFVLHNTVPKDEILGVVIGHIWYFFSDVYPPLHEGSRPLDPPRWWCRMFERQPPPGSEADHINHEIAVAGAPDVAPQNLQ